MTAFRAALSALAFASAASVGALSLAPVAHACGCFAPPDPSVPVVQAGERILFAMANGVVTAHIQIQYAGNAQEFGWILPLPSIPTLELGTDELFTSLGNTTQPKYRLQRLFEGNCNQRGGVSTNPPSAGQTNDSESDGGAGGRSPLVFQDSIGPYDYAVLRADSKTDLLRWLSDNRYFVPAGTDTVVNAYIRPNAYFLALKLRSGKSAGDLQPVVLKYPSDLPMIPIVLTSVAAQPNMGIQVFMLGRARAIPRNYYHTVINDALIDWQTGGQNYNDVIIRAVRTAPERHSFVTEYAGVSSVMRNQLDRTGRFGTQAALAARANAGDFIQYMQNVGYAFTSQVVSILTRYIPLPAGLARAGVSAAQWIQSFAFYSSADYQRRNPGQFQDWPGVDYKPAEMAQELEERIARPTRATSALFERYPYLTRLYTTLSPEDMTRDPVFSFNPTLLAYSNVHEATLTTYCDGSNQPLTSMPARLVTEQGYILQYPNGTGSRTTPTPFAASDSTPPSTRLEILREEGPPEVVVDNKALIQGGFSPRSCSSGGDNPAALPMLMLLLIAAGLVAWRRYDRRG